MKKWIGILTQRLYGTTPTATARPDNNDNNSNSGNEDEKLVKLGSSKQKQKANPVNAFSFVAKTMNDVVRGVTTSVQEVFGGDQRKNSHRLGNRYKYKYKGWKVPRAGIFH